jgi:flagellar biogenesis protein FliO
VPAGTSGSIAALILLILTVTWVLTRATRRH